MDTIQFTKRQLQILRFLKAHDEVSKAQLEALCGLQERTIRKDIADINARCEAPIITYQKMKGYQLIKPFVLPQQQEPKAENNRLFFIIKTLLFRDAPVDIFDLGEALFVSEATIEKDLLLIKQRYLQDSALSVTRREGKLFLLGDEKQKRSFLCDLLIRESSRNNFDLYNYQHCFETIDLQLIDQIVRVAITSYAVEFSDAMYMNLILHLAIAIERMMLYQAHSYQQPFTGYEQEDLQLAFDIAQAVEAHYPIQVSQNERTYLALLLHGKRSNRETIQAGALDFTAITSQLLSYLASSYDIDFTKDQELQEDLSLHLQGMHARLRSMVGSHNVLMEEIKHTYPFIFEMGIDMATYYEEQFHERMNEDEVGFIVLHLVCAFERYHHQNAKLQAIIVCPTGYSSSKILEIKIHNAFPDTVVILDTYSLAAFQQMELSRLDLIISTVEVTSAATPVFICSPFLSRMDIEQLDDMVRKLLKEKNPSDISHFFDPQLFFPALTFTRREEVITYLGQAMVQHGYVDASYVASVLEREAFSTTAYKDGIAIPHPMNMNAHQTKVAVGMLKKPIVWGTHKVQLVFLLAIRAQDKRRLFDLYESFARLSEQKQLYKQLLETTTCESFLTIFQCL